MDKRSLGRFGEQQAAEYLRKKGYNIIKMNFFCRAGEIDVIAEDKNYIVFAEVKLRKNADHGEAREFVTAAKQRRIIKTAQLWLCVHENVKQPRFDVIEVYAPDGERGRVKVNHIEDAVM